MHLVAEGRSETRSLRDLCQTQEQRIRRLEHLIREAVRAGRANNPIDQQRVWENMEEALLAR